MQNISYFSGNIGNWQMSGFCQKLTANVTWWDIDDPFWKFLLERLSKQLSWFLGVKFVRSLAGACLQYLKLSVRMTQLWQWHIVTVTCSPTESYSTTPHHTAPHHTTTTVSKITRTTFYSEMGIFIIYIFTRQCLRLAVCKCPNQNPY